MTGLPRLTNFDSWMIQVDCECAKLCGLSAWDLPDYCYADAHEDGMTPRQAARAAIRAAKDEGY